MDILVDELRKVFGNSDEGRLAEKLVEAYRRGGAREAKQILLEYLKGLGVDVEDKKD
ncbi:MAG: hypothetical protein ABWK05_01350 [Pyrobaculum sp.]